MTAQQIISHYNRLNGNDISGKRLREFHTDIQNWLDKNGSGPHTKQVNAIRSYIAKAVKAVKKNEVVEVKVKPVKVVPVASSRLPAKKEVAKVDKKPLDKKRQKKIDKKPVNRVPRKKKKVKKVLGNVPLIDKIEVKPEIKKKVDKQVKDIDSKLKNQNSKSTNLAGVNYSYKEIDLGPYKKDFHRMFSDSIVQVHGLPGHGKTVWLLKNAQYRAQQGEHVLYVAREEYGRSVFDMKLREHNIGHNNLRFRRTLEPADIAWATVIYLDSVSALKLTHEDIEDLSIKFPNKNWIVVLQSTKEGDFRGSQEWEHLVDIAGEIRNRKLILHKNRLDPNNSEKREKLLKDDAITEAKKRATIRQAVKQGMEPKPAQV